VSTDYLRGTEHVDVDRGVDVTTAVNFAPGHSAPLATAGGALACSAQRLAFPCTRLSPSRPPSLGASGPSNANRLRRPLTRRPLPWGWRLRGIRREAVRPGILSRLTASISFRSKDFSPPDTSTSIVPRTPRSSSSPLDAIVLNQFPELRQDHFEYAPSQLRGRGSSRVGARACGYGFSRSGSRGGPSAPFKAQHH
jgi:hypothetical protein